MVVLRTPCRGGSPKGRYDTLSAQTLYENEDIASLQRPNWHSSKIVKSKWSFRHKDEKMLALKTLEGL
jgi:hypothetical protein